jgi:hypothetical protein
MDGFCAIYHRRATFGVFNEFAVFSAEIVYNTENFNNFI